jgi:hypothetical protein
MRIYQLIIFSILTVLMFGCTPIDDAQLAERYKLDLQYSDQALKFMDMNMTQEAEMSCNMTATLRSDCFTIIVMQQISKSIAPKKNWCQEIKPNEKINMSRQAYGYVYPEINADLQRELNQKLNPSKDRRRTLQQIKDNCLKIAK